MEPVLVTATRLEEPVSSTSASATVITGEASVTRPAST
jgi:outer membrane cobalamin receptor